MAQPPVDFRTRSFQFACMIIHLYRTALTEVPPPLARQLLRSGTSVGANLEEAKAAQSRRDLVARFSLALKEAREAAYWLRLLRATAYVSDRAVSDVLLEANELIAILTTSLKRLRRTDTTG